jgi:transposase
VMIDWLVERNITHDTTHTKPELCGIIKQHKTRSTRYKLDTLLHEHGHNVLRLPPYHPEFNLIEKIWAIVKNWVAVRNTTFKIADVEDLARQKFDSVTSETWSSVCEHVDKFVD